MSVRNSVVVNDDGNYAIPQLARGKYTLTAEYDVVLTAGAVAEEVGVGAAAPLVTTETATIENIVDRQKIAELPLNGRDNVPLAFLQPNVFLTAQGSKLGSRRSEFFNLSNHANFGLPNQMSTSSSFATV